MRAVECCPSPPSAGLRARAEPAPRAPRREASCSRRRTARSYPAPAAGRSRRARGRARRAARAAPERPRAMQAVRARCREAPASTARTPVPRCLRSSARSTAQTPPRARAPRARPRSASFRFPPHRPAQPASRGPSSPRRAACVAAPWLAGAPRTATPARAPATAVRAPAGARLRVLREHLDLGHEAVTAAVHGFNRLLVRAALAQDAPGVQDRPRHRDLSDLAVRPDGVEQLLFGDHAPAVLDQEPEHVECLAPNLQGATCARKRVGVEVEFELAEPVAYFQRHSGIFVDLH